MNFTASINHSLIAGENTRSQPIPGTKLPVLLTSCWGSWQQVGVHNPGPRSPTVSGGCTAWPCRVAVMETACKHRVQYLTPRRWQFCMCLFTASAGGENEDSGAECGGCLSFGYKHLALLHARSIITYTEQSTSAMPWPSCQFSISCIMIVTCCGELPLNTPLCVSFCYAVSDVISLLW